MEDEMLSVIMYVVGFAAIVPIVLLRRWFRYLKAPHDVIPDSEKNSIFLAHFFAQAIFAIITTVSLRGQWPEFDTWLDENGLMIFPVIAMMMLLYSLTLWVLIQAALRLLNPRYKAWKKAGYPKDSFKN